MKDIEIEIQARVEKRDALETFLEAEASFVSEKRQIDEYFTPAHRNFLDMKPIQEWFRLRDEGGTYSMNYKKWHYNTEGIGEYADEFETVIDDIESARKILAALDCTPLVRVDKLRKKWMWNDYEVALDKVKGLGDFVEIEHKGTEAVDPKKTAEAMVGFLKAHDCGKIELNNGGYPYLLLFPGEAHYIVVN